MLQIYIVEISITSLFSISSRKTLSKKAQKQKAEKPVHWENQTLFHPDYCGNEKFVNNEILVWNDK